MWAVADLKKYTPGFEKARLRTMGASSGVRESRKVDSETRAVCENLTGLPYEKLYGGE